jgi:hypothetical protein
MPDQPILPANVDGNVENELPMVVKWQYQGAVDYLNWSVGVGIPPEAGFTVDPSGDILVEAHSARDETEFFRSCAAALNAEVSPAAHRTGVASEKPDRFQQFEASGRIGPLDSAMNRPRTLLRLLLTQSRSTDEATE